MELEDDVNKKLIQILNDEIIPFSQTASSGYTSLLNLIGDSRIVLIGESSHGTEEFYQARIELSKRLLKEKHFHAIAIEGDWPSAYPVNNYVQGVGETDSVACLNDFNRFPEWMWRNTTIPPFLEWLRNYNRSNSNNIGFYGLDLYSLHSSMQAVISYLQKHDPDAAEKAIQRYACFDNMGIDPQMYGYLTESGVKKSCVKEVTDQLTALQFSAYEKIKMHNHSEEDKLFYAVQNARIVKNAEHYYRTMFESHYESWNIRDLHMAETLENIISHIETKIKQPAKIIIWAHNSHVGDARASEMLERKEINLGQIVRERFDNISFHLGFSTYSGTVRAADEWDSPSMVKSIVPSISGSYENLFHRLRNKNFLLDMHRGNHVKYLLMPQRLQRAIGVIYRPETERQSHYHFAKLPLQFDAVIHFDETTALSVLPDILRDG